MTQRDRPKRAQPAAARATGRTTRSGAASAVKLQVNPLEEVERERDELRLQLTAAEARIKQLEGQRLDALNRIDWAIDSIHNILERET